MHNPFTMPVTTIFLKKKQYKIVLVYEELNGRYYVKQRNRPIHM